MKFRASCLALAVTKVATTMQVKMETAKTPRLLIGYSVLADATPVDLDVVRYFIQFLTKKGNEISAATSAKLEIRSRAPDNFIFNQFPAYGIAPNPD
jgi:hypothetical protein